MSKFLHHFIVKRLHPYVVGGSTNLYRPIDSLIDWIDWLMIEDMSKLCYFYVQFESSLASQVA